MKKLLTLSTIALMVIFAASFAIAGDWHSGANNTCSDCHTMHFSRSHDMAGGLGDDTWQLGSTGPNHYLLKAPVNELCLSCHDGQTDIPDVLGADTNDLEADAAAGGRSAGALNEVGGVDDYADYTGHTLGSTAAAPGGIWAAAEGLECVDCHSQHGRSNGYRNTFSPASRVISYAKEAEDKTGKHVYETYGHGATVAQHYGQNYIGLLEPDQTASGVADYCKDCHTNFHGAKGGLEVGGNAEGEWTRHPNSNANIGALSHGHSTIARHSGRLYRVRTMSATGDWGTQGTAWTGAPTDLTPTCLSCHKAHGNHNAFGLILATGAAPIGEDGDTTDFKAICTQCHGQGG